MKWLVVVAFGLVACGPTPKPATPVVTPVLPPVADDVPVAPAPPEVLAYLDGTLSTLAREYVDPRRFDFRRMLDGALDAMEREIAEVIAETANDKVTVRVSDKQHEFAGDVDSLAELGVRLTEIIHFVQASANPDTKKRDVELTAVNGMTRTLDPHTFIIPADEMKEWEINLGGKFAGVGMVIHLKPYNGVDRIAVQKITPNTPAERGGLQAGDHILAINGQSTEAFTLDEAQSRLRGEPNTQVKLLLDRAGKQLELSFTRAEILVRAVESRMLGGKIGYVLVDRFSETTAPELQKAMEALRDQGARGWVLDLRENSGGLLNQAVKCADLFVEYGTIVATVSGGKKHGIKNATTGGVDTRSPLVVLIGDNTASSAEILAGALKQLDRAVLVGQRTFGKGSVQILESAAHGAKLKITVEEYVAANDISVQNVGIAPDVELVPATVPKKLGEPLRLIPPKPLREVDLGSHLDSAQPLDRDKPLATIHYVKVEDDYEIRFARDLALATKARTRTEMLRAVPKIAARARADAETSLIAALKTLDIDWRAAKTAAPKLRAMITSASPRVTAGERVEFTGEITNDGAAAVSRVHVRGVSDDPNFDGVELAFGAIAPHATKRATTFVKLGNAASPRTSSVEWNITADTKPAGTASTELAIDGMQYPHFLLTSQLVDGNDNIPKKGEPLRIRIHVTNRGPARSNSAIATLKSLAGERVLVDRGRIDIGPLAPNESKDVELGFSTKPDVDVDRIGLELAVTDATLGVGESEEIEIAFGTKPAPWKLTPPRIFPDDTPLETTADTIRVTGKVEDDDLVDDFFIVTWPKKEPRKVFYASNRGAKTKSRLDFAADVPLVPGPNRITLTARETDKSLAVRTVWVYRK